ncbi:MAG TPA: PEP-CTERM sorting domain-containing protein [Candidatus Deferrimicrobiaceae bacterium]|jgi:hypothetical protein
MNKIWMVLLLVLNVSIINASTARATIFTDIKDLDKIGFGLIGSGTLKWQHNTPDGFKIPPDTVNSAALDIFLKGWNVGADPLYVEGVKVGDVPNFLKINIFGSAKEFNFNIAPVFSPTWGGGMLDIALNYSCLDLIYLDKSKFTLDYTKAVPEPGTFVLLGFGLVAVAFVTRRRTLRQ